ncbi:MAG TPA: GNAT family N-acetyltransferase [Phycisphaerae bacterium]|nr:GNAT family N-acetyltransferase [Phycisphaerae bacterium]
MKDDSKENARACGQPGGPEDINTAISVTDCRFRPATNADAEAVRSLVFSVLSEYGLGADPACTDRDLSDIEGSYAAHGGCFEVIVDAGGQVIGSYGLYPLREGVCELRKMYLRRDCRGRGLGNTIMRRVLQQAPALGFRRMELETAAVLKEAIALYQAFGFRPFEPDHMSARCNLAMFLDLPPAKP